MTGDGGGTESTPADLVGNVCEARLARDGARKSGATGILLLQEVGFSISVRDVDFLSNVLNVPSAGAGRGLAAGNRFGDLPSVADNWTVKMQNNRMKPDTAHPIIINFWRFRRSEYLIYAIAGCPSQQDCLVPLLTDRLFESCYPTICRHPGQWSDVADSTCALNFANEYFRCAG